MKNTNSKYLISLMVFLGCFFGGVCAAEKPNVIFILVDDMGYSDLGCYGSEIDTPNIESLEKSGKMEETIIVFASDNGLAVGKHGLMGKQNVYDHAVHVPLIISGPGIPKGETRDQLCYMYDIYPTLCDRAGLKVPETVEFSSLNNLLNDAETTHREHLYFAFIAGRELSVMINISLSSTVSKGRGIHSYLTY